MSAPGVRSAMSPIMLAKEILVVRARIRVRPRARARARVRVTNPNLGGDEAVERELRDLRRSRRHPKQMVRVRVGVRFGVRVGVRGRLSVRLRVTSCRWRARSSSLARARPGEA